MKYEPGQRLSSDEMMRRASEALAIIEEQFTEMFGRVPMPDDIAYVCTNKKCGWWDDSIEALLVIERIYGLDNRNGVLVKLETPKVDIQIVCPQCRFAVQAIKAEIYLQQQQAKGYGVVVQALKHKRQLSSLRPS